MLMRVGGGGVLSKGPRDQFSMCAHVAALICLNVTNAERNGVGETARPSRRTINGMNFGMWLIVLKGSGAVNFSKAATPRRFLVSLPGVLLPPSLDIKLLFLLKNGSQ